MFGLLWDLLQGLGDAGEWVRFISQAGVPVGGQGGGGGAAGTMIGAILESVGYHYQSLILEEFSDVLTGQIAGLIYLLGITFAVVQVAVQGEYRLVVWMLIGPALFFSIVVPRSSLANARWTFGFEERNSSEVNREVQRVVEAANTSAGVRTAQVSTVFARYVELVSATAQELVHLISRQRRDADLWFVVRAELFSLLHTGQIYDHNVLNLVHLSLFGRCRTVLDAARAAQDPLFREAQHGNPDFREIFRTPQAQNAMEYFQSRHQQAHALYQRLLMQTDVNIDQATATYVAVQLESGAAAPGQPPTAPPEPELTGPGGSAAPGTFSVGPDLHQRIVELSTQPQSCGNIWTWTMRALQQFAARELEEILATGEDLGIERGPLLNVFEQGHGINRPDPLIYAQGNISSAADALNTQRLIAHYIFRNEASNPNRATWIGGFVTNLEARSLEGSFQGYNSFTEQARLGAQEWSEKERLIHAAGSLPYYQGLGLYVLGISFPFFALLLLIPGKHAGFLFWFMLWLWLKSWDVALAMVMLVDDIMFAMFSVQRQTIGRSVGTTPEQQQMDIAFASLAEMDPTFQLSTYYTIIATLILAVPITTAQLILGSLRGGATLISAGMEKQSRFFSSIMLKGTEQIAINDLRSQALDNRAKRMEQYMNLAKANKSPWHGDGVDKNGMITNPAAGSPVPLNRLAGKLASVHGAGGAELVKSLAEHSHAGGWASGFMDSAKPLGSHAEKFSSAVAQIYFSQRHVKNAAWTGTLKLIEQDLRTLAKHAAWDEDAGHQATQLHERIAIYGGIPIPWTGLTQEGSREEFNYLLGRYRFQQAMAQAQWGATREVVNSFRTLATGVFQRIQHNLTGKLDDEKIKAGWTGQVLKGLEAGELLSLGAIANLPADARAQISHAFHEFATKMGIAGQMVSGKGPAITHGGHLLSLASGAPFAHNTWKVIEQRIYGPMPLVLDPTGLMIGGSEEGETPGSVHLGTFMNPNNPSNMPGIISAPPAAAPAKPKPGGGAK